MKELELIARARAHGDKIAIRSGSDEFTYAELLNRSENLAAAVCGGGSGVLGEKRSTRRKCARRDTAKADAMGA